MAQHAERIQRGLGRIPVSVVLIVIAPCVLAFLVYARYLDLWFWTDDFVWLEAASNPNFSAFIKNAFEFPQGSTPYWRPASDFYFFSMYRVFGLNAAAYHWTNILLHVATATGLGLVTLCLSRSAIAGALAGCLYAVSPAYASMVSWASGATGVLAAFFIVLTLLLFVHWLERKASYGWLALPVTTFTVALLAKEDASPLPVVLVIVAALTWKPTSIRQVWRVVLACLPFAAVAAAYAALQFLFVVGSHEVGQFQLGAHAMPRIIDSLVWLSFPVRLSYAEWVSPARWAVFFALTALTLLSAFRRRWLLPSLYVATAVMLIPSSFLKPAFEPRWTMLASIPWAMFAATLIAQAYDAAAKVSRPIAIVAGVCGCAMVLLSLSARTVDTQVRVPWMSAQYQAIDQAIASGCPELNNTTIVYVTETPITTSRYPGYAVPALIQLRFHPGLAYVVAPWQLEDASFREESSCTVFWTEGVGYQAEPTSPLNITRHSTPWIL